MGFPRNGEAPLHQRPPMPVKIVIAGGFGVGKTTAVSQISEIPVLTTEAPMTEVAAAIDRAEGVPEKTSTTVALDFGAITIDDEIKLYLFGTPGQDRFSFMWDDLTEGALGALAIVDSRRLDDCYPAVDYFERATLPFVVAVNQAAQDRGLRANDLVKVLGAAVNGRGGGKADLAQGSGKGAAGIDAALAAIRAEMGRS